jgi:hypothetical protein
MVRGPFGNESLSGTNPSACKIKRSIIVGKANITKPPRISIVLWRDRIMSSYK